MLLVLGLVAVFLGLLLALAASGSIVGQRRQARRQLAVVASVSRLRSDYRPDRCAVRPRIVVPTLDWLSRLRRRLAPSNQNARIRRRLDLAGNPRSGMSTECWRSRCSGSSPEPSWAWLFHILGAAPLVTLGCASLLRRFARLLSSHHAGVPARLQPTQQLRRAAGCSRPHDDLGQSPACPSMLHWLRWPGTPPDHWRKSSSGPSGDADRLGSGPRRCAPQRRTHLPELRTFVLAMFRPTRSASPWRVLRIQADEMRVKRSHAEEGGTEGS